MIRTAPPIHRNIKRSLNQVRGLARHVGGRTGRGLEALMMAVGNGGPDLGVYTRNCVSVHAAGYLNALGAFKPDDVAISTMKRMRLDPQIQLALAATKSPIVQAPVFFESSSREARAVCEAAWLESGILRELQRSSLNAVDFGFAPHEKIWEAKEQFKVEWSTPGDQVATVNQKSKTYPVLFVPKKPKDLDPAHVTLLCDEYGNFQGLFYGSPPQGQQELIDRMRKSRDNILLPEKTFVFTVNEEFGNLYGRSRLVSAYDPWFWQRIIYLITNRWYERKGDPPYIGYAPSDPTLMDPGVDEDDDYDPTDENQAPILRLRQLIQNSLRSSGVIVVPSEPYKDDQGKPSQIRAYDVKEMAVQDSHPAFLDYLKHLDAKKTRALLVPDGAIAASENSGTYGSTKSLSSLAVQIQNETLNSWVRHFNQYYLSAFLRYNGIKDRVTLTTTGISEDNRDVILTMLEKTYEADMLLAQAWGPQFPDSLDRLVSRKRMLRSINIPYDEPEPGAKPPTLPKPPPAPADPNKAKGGDSKKGKTKSGL